MGVILSFKTEKMRYIKIILFHKINAMCDYNYKTLKVKVKKYIR